MDVEKKREKREMMDDMFYIRNASKYNKKKINWGIKIMITECDECVWLNAMNEEDSR